MNPAQVREGKETLVTSCHYYPLLFLSLEELAGPQLRSLSGLVGVFLALSTWIDK